MERAKGDYFVFFDSDCVIPPTYFETLSAQLRECPYDCFGGPDTAHDSFTDTQKAINYTMTSFLTTGGIRGGKVSLEKFTPRTFNMGFARKVFEKVGGFREMFSEDIDMSTRIRLAGFTIGLYTAVPVWHKRRIDWRKFWHQVHIFGMSRITLKLLYPDSLKLVHTLPAVAVIGCILLVLLGIFVTPWFFAPLIAYFLAIFICALIATKSLKIAAYAIPAAIIQLGGYGTGFIQAYFTKILLGKGRDEAQEVALRKGK
jgi:GT2 family glycosyltransferase